MPTTITVPTQQDLLDAILKGEADAKAAKDFATNLVAANAQQDAVLAGFITQLQAAQAANAASDALIAARVAALEALVKPPAGGEQPKTFTATDFAQNNAGHLFPTGVVGRGSALDIYQVAPGTSTKAGIANASATNPLRVLRAGAMSGALVKALRLSGIRVLGYVGHNQHGVTVGYADSPYIDDVSVIGARGSGSTPPYETFGLEAWQCLSPTIKNCLIDGQNVAGTLLGLNSVHGATVSNVKATGTLVGFGAAVWQTGDSTFDQLDLRGCRRALNFEQCYGSITVTAPDLNNRNSPSSAGPDVVVVTAGTYTIERGPQAGQKGGSIKFRLVEPKWDRNRPLIIGVPPLGSAYAAGEGNVVQRCQDIELVVDGVTYRPTANNGMIIPRPGGGSVPLAKIGNYWGQQW